MSYQLRLLLPMAAVASLVGASQSPSQSGSLDSLQSSGGPDMAVNFIESPVHLPQRVKRQLDQLLGGGAGGASTGGGGGGASNPLSLLADLAPHVERAHNSLKLLTSIMGPDPKEQRRQQLAQEIAQQLPQPQAQQSAPSTSEQLAQLSSILRNFQGGSSSSQQPQVSTNYLDPQAGLQQAQNTGTGFKAALGELSQGLQRIAINNPTLLPEVKHLYQSVTSKLTGPPPASLPPAGVGASGLPNFNQPIPALPKPVQ